MLETYIIPIGIFVVLGTVAGLLLSVASKKLAVKVDERVGEVRECLPGANCGACGYAGCDEYAVALIEKNEKITLCKPGGADTAKQIGGILGEEAEVAEREVAFVKCNGVPSATTAKYEYKGTQTCAANNLLFSGKGSCAFGCLGFGDCTVSCEFDAIHIVDGVAKVDPEKCTACGACVKTCPKAIIALRPISKEVKVLCSNKDKGGITRKSCTNGCIGCMKCQKTCEFGAITVTNNVATIDHSKCTNCKACVEVCPVKCIHLD